MTDRRSPHATSTTARQTFPSPFAMPQGFKGRLAGWYMGLSDRQHRELDHHVPLAPDATLLEVGFGPGQMIEALWRRERTITALGVDPSELMVRVAAKRNRTIANAGQLDLRQGTAADIPFADDVADVVLSVNNLPMWPDCDAGLDAIGRVLKPHGTVLVAWHGGTDPKGHQKRLVQPVKRLEYFDDAFGRHFKDVSRKTIRHSELWIARDPV